MPHIVIASNNPIKIKAVRIGFQKMFPEQKFSIVSIVVSSGVGDQPKGDSQTLKGAKNRARNAQNKIPTADYWVGIEGGVEETKQGMGAFAWVFVVSKDTLTGAGKTGTFFLPPAVVGLIKQGKELGEANDIVFSRKDSKRKNGAVGILTADRITRAQFYTPAVILALIPFKNKNLYKH